MLCVRRISSNSAFYPHFRVLSSIPRFILNSAFYPQFRFRIPVPHSGSVFRFRIPVPYSGSAFRFRIPVTYSGSAFYPYPVTAAMLVFQDKRILMRCFCHVHQFGRHLLCCLVPREQSANALY